MLIQSNSKVHLLRKLVLKHGHISRQHFFTLFVKTGSKTWAYIQAAGRLLPGRLCCACEVRRREAHQPLMGNSKIGPSVNLVADDKENQALIEPVNGDKVKPNDGAFDVS